MRQTATKELLASDSNSHADFLRDVFHPVGDYPIALVIDQLAQYGLDTRAYRALAGDGWRYVRLVRDSTTRMEPRLH